MKKYLLSSGIFVGVIFGAWLFVWECSPGMCLKFSYDLIGSQEVAKQALIDFDETDLIVDHDSLLHFDFENSGYFPGGGDIPAQAFYAYNTRYDFYGEVELEKPENGTWTLVAVHNKGVEKMK